MGTGKYRVGARVRDWAGDEATIIGKRKGERQVRYDNPDYAQNAWFDKSSLTPVDPAPATQEAWVPKVGDRVRMLRNNCGREGWGRAGEIGTVLSADESNTDASVQFSTSGKWYAQFRDLEPLPVAGATGLVVQAGKFYRTRDGRKVGPIGVVVDKEWPFDGTLEGSDSAYYNADGTCPYIPHHDLVAEWVDEPQAKPAAPPPKFKAGDRVTPRADKLFRVVVHWKNHWQRAQGRAHADVFFVTHDGTPHLGIQISARPGGDGPWWPAEFFEPAAPTPPATPTDSFIVARLTANGLPRPNARPRVHATLAAAETEAQRLANRLGDDFAVYQRVSTRTVDAGPVPTRWGMPFDAALAKGWVRYGQGEHPKASTAGLAFEWGQTKQGFGFWSDQCSALTPLGRAILRKWIAEAESKEAA